MKRVLIVTPDIMGPVHNGGVGTSCKNLAVMLTNNGYSVEILYANGFESENPPAWDKWVSFYKLEGITLSKLEKSDFEVLGHQWTSVSYRVYHQIKDRNFDVVVFPDMFGVGYYSQQAKKLGLAFENTKFLIKFLGPQTWSRRDSNKYWSSPHELIVPMFERLSVEWADHVQIATNWSKNWCAENGWLLPGSTTMLFPLATPSTKPRSNATKKVDELVFFGRLEERKGLSVFLKALQHLQRERKLDFKTVTFLGRSTHINGESAIDYIQRARIKGKVKIKTTLQSNEAIEYLRSRQCLAVILSKSETMGYTVVECLEAGVPFIASRIEPFEILVGPKHQNKLVSPDSYLAVANAIAERKAIIDPARALELFTKTQKKWLMLFAQLSRRGKVAPIKLHKKPKISVLIAHHNRPEYLTEALDSLLIQSEAPFEVLVYDDASSDQRHVKVCEKFKASFAERDIKFRYHQGRVNRGPSYARNALAKKSTGDFLLFMDDDNKAVPREIKTLTSMQRHTNADVITMSIAQFIDGQEDLWMDRHWVPSGFDLASSIFENGMGDTSFLMRKSLFSKIGGFIDEPGYKAEDMNVLVKASLTGAKMFVCPEPLIKYRVHQTNRSLERDPAERLFHARFALKQRNKDPMPRLSLDPLAEYMMYVAGPKDPQSFKLPPPWPKQLSNEQTSKRINLIHLAQKKTSLGTVKKFGIGLEVRLQSSTWELNVEGPCKGFLLMTLVSEKDTNFRCSNPVVDQRINPGVTPLTIPLTLEMRKRPFKMVFSNLDRVFASSIEWVDEISQ